MRRSTIRKSDILCPRSRQKTSDTRTRHPYTASSTTRWHPLQLWTGGFRPRTLMLVGCEFWWATDPCFLCQCYNFSSILLAFSFHCDASIWLTLDPQTILCPLSLLKVRRISKVLQSMASSLETCTCRRLPNVLWTSVRVATVLIMLHLAEVSSSDWHCLFSAVNMRHL